jgi:formiminotetrahydrofolate cyclodeaminase
LGSSDLFLPLPDFLDAVAAETPAPGGGSAAAVAGAMGAALVEMTARYSHDWERAATAGEAARLLREKLLRLAAEDAEAYAAYLAAEPSERSAALVRATEVPAAVAQAAADVLMLARQAQTNGNHNLEGDVLVAIGLASAAEIGAKRLVEINRKKGG